MFYKIGQSLKPFLLLVDIMSRKAFCYSIPGEKNMTKIITAYNKFLQQVDYVKAVEGDGDRLTRTLKENIRKYRSSAGTLGNLQNMIDTVINMYNDSPHRGIQGKTPNQMWDNTKEQEKRNIIETMSNDKILIS